MPRRPKAFDIWKGMKPPALRRLALAAFLLFSVIGPLGHLMDQPSSIIPWRSIILDTLGAGGFAASMILFARKRWWITLLIVIFWTSVLAGEGILSIHQSTSIEPPRALTPEDLDATGTERVVLGWLAVVLLVLGYTTFIRVISNEIQKRARFETEVKIAQDIQQSLLPESTVQTSWYSIAGITIPATEVGGDFFDVIQISDDCVAIAIADVTGHGVGPGILSAMTKSALHSRLEYDTSPASVLANLNKTIFDLSEEKMFVTFAYLVADRSQNMVRLATAGHPPILYKHHQSNKIEELRTVNLGLGIKRDAQFSDVEIPFAQDDSLLLYTDGVIEAMNIKDEEYGNEQLRRVVASANGSPEQVCDEIVKKLHEFTKNDVFQDDVSIVCIKFS